MINSAKAARSISNKKIKVMKIKPEKSNNVCVFWKVSWEREGTGNENACWQSEIREDVNDNN